MSSEQERDTLQTLFEQAVREDSKESKDALLSHWKTLCELLDSVED